MPTYVYECRQCERVIEIEQRISEDPLTDCQCGAQGGLRRIIQPTAVMFKGDGFHINDYSGSKPEPAASETSSSESSSSSAE